ncbi:innate immunity activator protein [Ambystoma mexicanum]|uniref:innate immunity activator protein n=1 Tax=Ambystoma mexicanum TaxID=8296 RepID=UPI0037E70672
MPISASIPASTMESKEEVSDTDSGIIVQSGSDSPIAPMKDLTQAMKKQQKALEERLEACLNELKIICLREAELTGKLPAEFPLKPGEKAPKVRRRVGTTFRLDDQKVLSRSEDPLSWLERDLALQQQIVEAARRLYREEHLGKQIRRHRKQALVREQKKLKDLENRVNEQRRSAGQKPLRRTSAPLIEELSASDESSLSDSAILDEDEGKRPKSAPCANLQESRPPRQVPMSPLPVARTVRPQPPQTLEGLKSVYPEGGETERSPIQNSPWRESSLDQPYQKPRKLSMSSGSQPSSPAVTPVLGRPELPRGDTSPYPFLPIVNITVQSLQGSSSAPSTPEMQSRRGQSQSVRIQSPRDPSESRGRSMVPRRRVTEFTVTVPDYCFPHAKLSHQRSNPTYNSSSEDSNSDISSISHATSTGGTSPDMTPPRTARHLPPRQHSPVYLNRPFGEMDAPTFYQRPQKLIPPGYFAAVEYIESRPPQSARRDCSRTRTQLTVAKSVPHLYDEEMAQPRPQKVIPSKSRIVRTPSIECTGRALAKVVVCEELQHWHDRTRLRSSARPHSLDRQGAIKVRNPAGRGMPLARSMTQRTQVPQRHVLRRTAEGAPLQWYDPNEAQIISQV